MKVIVAGDFAPQARLAKQIKANLFFMVWEASALMRMDSEIVFGMKDI